MGLITEFTYVNITNKNKKYYKEKGYNFTDKEKNIKVKVKDLPNGSNAKVEVKCDNCKEILIISWRTYIKHVHDNEIYYCGKNKNNCSTKILLKGELNGFYGKHHNKESIEKMKNNNWSKNHKRELSPNWNPNLTDEERLNNRSKNPEYTEFVKKVMARDNYTCKCCGKILNNNGIVHHLDGYNWCVERRTDETNGITLCKTCHKEFHSIYGYGNNTKEQFEEWMGYTIGELEKYDEGLPTARKIYCIEEDKVYNSAKELANEWDLKTTTNIYNQCNKIIVNNKLKSKTVRGKHLLWYEEYKNFTKEELNEYKKNNPYKNIYKYNNMYIYSIKNVLLFYGTRKECCCWMVNNKYSKNIKSATSSIYKYYKNNKVLNPRNKNLISIYFKTQI